MIFVTLKHIRVKEGKHNDFNTHILALIKQIKMSELNLSTDGIWKDENNFLIIERWSTMEAWKKYQKTEEYKSLWEAVNEFVNDKPKLFEYQTIS